MFEHLLALLARSLDAADLPYMIIGGQAVLLYGEPRLTRDIDVTLGAPPDRLSDLLEVADQLGLQPLVDPEPFVSDTLVLPCEHPDTGIRVDFIFSFSAYEQEAMQRIRRVEIEGAEVRFASPEDLLIHKLVAGRPRDLNDARSVLLKNPQVEVSYIRHWLSLFSEALGRPSLDTFNTLYRETR